MTVPRSLARRFATLLLAAALALGLAAAAQACPNCTNSLAGGDEASQQLVRGYFWSILFMMSMPFAIVVGLGGYMYWEVRKARGKSRHGEGGDPTGQNRG